MKKVYVISIMFILTLLLIYCSSTNISSKRREDALIKDRKHNTEWVMNNIRGSEKKRADSVFKNIKTMRFLTAEDLVQIVMNDWGRSLGVSCNHCHDNRDFSSEAKVEKQMARDMVSLQTRLHKELLDSLIFRVRGKIPRLNCYSCHRGQPIPAFKLPNN